MLFMITEAHLWGLCENKTTRCRTQIESKKMKMIDHPRTVLFMEMKAALARITAFNTLSWETVNYSENKPVYDELVQKLLKAEQKLATYDDKNPAPVDIIKQRERFAHDKRAGFGVLIDTDRFTCCAAEMRHYERQQADAQKRLG